MPVFRCPCSGSVWRALQWPSCGTLRLCVWGLFRPVLLPQQMWECPWEMDWEVGSHQVVAVWDKHDIHTQFDLLFIIQSVSFRQWTSFLHSRSGHGQCCGRTDYRQQHICVRTCPTWIWSVIESTFHPISPQPGLFVWCCVLTLACCVLFGSS